MKESSQRDMARTPGAEQVASRIEALESSLGLPSGETALEARLAALEALMRERVSSPGAANEIPSTAARALVEAHVPPGDLVAVLSDGPAAQISPWATAFLVYGRSGPNPTPGGTDGEGSAAIAHLEALRAQGIRFVLVLRSAVGWFERTPAFAHHLRSRSACVADEPGVGLLFDTHERSAMSPSESMLDEVLDRSLRGELDAPVLDMTTLGVADIAPNRNVFEPPGHGSPLPYLEATIDVVVVDEAGGGEEARRVARGAVLTVAGHADGAIVVTSVDELRDSTEEAIGTVLVLVVDSGPEDPWLEVVREAVAGSGERVEVRASRDPARDAADAGAEAVVVAQRGVLPLPGCLDATVATLTSDERVGGVAPKLFAADGTLEAAGGMEFADGAVRGIGAGAGPSHTAAAWHEYVRPVSAGVGLIALRPSALREAPTGGGSPAALSAHVWAAGYEVRYQPDAHAVRVHRSEIEDGGPERGSLRPLPGRPACPATLDGRAWRWLLTRHHVQEAGR